MQGITGEPVYLDLAGVAPGPRIHDVAYAIANLALWSSAEEAVDPDSFTWAQVPTLIQAYEEGAGWTLSSLEREALPAYIAAVPLFLDICGWSDEPQRTTTRWVLDHGVVV